MLQVALLLLFCLLMGMFLLAISAWAVVSGRLYGLDGLLMVAVGVLLGALFLANVAWSAWKGELRELLEYLRHRRAGGSS